MIIEQVKDETKPVDEPTTPVQSDTENEEGGVTQHHSIQNMVSS